LLEPEEHAAVADAPVVSTPSGGVHVYLRLTEPVAGCRYARTSMGECLIEVRGEQHGVVAPGSPPACHSSGRPYVFDQLGWLDSDDAAPVSLRVYDRLTAKAAALNEYRRPAGTDIVGSRPARTPSGQRPGDEFNAVVAWRAILGRHGWAVHSCAPGVTYWTRPGKATGVSATTGHCHDQNGNDLLYVFSTSAPPFEPDKAYSRFAAFTLLTHGGDYSASASVLAGAGYGRGKVVR
jgi:hypothetical protein